MPYIHASMEPAFGQQHIHDDWAANAELIQR